jgi:hypothetical protein
MRLLTAVVALSLLGIGGAEGAWGDGRKLPKPIDSPIVRHKVREDHKPGKRQRHPPGPSPYAYVAPDATIARA